MDEEPLPDDSGYSEPGLTARDLREKWEPWVVECLTFMSSDFYKLARLRYDLPLDQYPSVDLQIYSAVLARAREIASRKKGNV